MEKERISRLYHWLGGGVDSSYGIINERLWIKPLVVHWIMVGILQQLVIFIR